MYNNLMLKFEKSYELKEYHITMPVKDYYDKYVDYEQTEKTCKVCDEYNNNWSCPPFEGDILEVWNDFEFIDLLLLQLNYNDFITENTFSRGDIDTILNITLHNEKRKNLQNLRRKSADYEKYPNNMILSTGNCNLCPECNRKSAKPCRYPKNRLYSMESLGALVSKTTEELFGVKIQWVDKDEGKIPSSLTLLMGFLH